MREEIFVQAADAVEAGQGTGSCNQLLSTTPMIVARNLMCKYSLLHLGPWKVGSQL